LGEALAYLTGHSGRRRGGLLYAFYTSKSDMVFRIVIKYLSPIITPRPNYPIKRHSHELFQILFFMMYKGITSKMFKAYV
jgi:hypothetical protein